MFGFSKLRQESPSQTCYKHVVRLTLWTVVRVKFLGPYKISEVAMFDTFSVEVPDGTRLSFLLHRDRLVHARGDGGRLRHSK